MFPNCLDLIIVITCGVEIIFFSMALTALTGPWPLLQFRNNFFYTGGRTAWTYDKPVARPLPTHRTAQTQNKHTQTSMP
jgi:uncharacterized iron-regulated membrane protein